MNILIAKLGATGDVVRTTTLLSCFHDHITWLTEAKNAPLLDGYPGDLRCLTWEDREVDLSMRAIDAGALELIAKPRGGADELRAWGKHVATSVRLMALCIAALVSPRARA